jgi:hypothetical protein
VKPIALGAIDPQEGLDMRRHLHRFKLIFVLSLMLPAIAAAPAAAMFEGPVGPQVALSQPTSPPSTTLCSEVCDSAIAHPIHHPSLRGAAVVRAADHGGGFAWGDAGIGAGAAFAVLAVLLGAAVAATTRRRVGQPGAPVAG